MLDKDFRLPNRAIKVDPDTISRSAGTLLGALVIAALLGFMAIWQVPSLVRDWQILQAPIYLTDGEVRDGKCTAYQAFFVQCEAHLVYDYDGQHYEADVRQFFLDAHIGDYSVDLVIARGRPDLATISIAIDKYWNRILLLGVFLAGFAAMVGAALVTTVRVARARRRLAVPSSLSLVEVEVEATGVTVYSRPQYSYKEPTAKRATMTLFNKGQQPLVLWDDAGVPHGYAVKHENVDVPVLLDRGLERIDLTPAERAPLLAIIAADKGAPPAPPEPSKARTFFGGLWTTLRRFIFILVFALVAGLGYWLYYVLAGSNSHDQFGMQVNMMMPAAVNTWACGKLELRFGDENAPTGCTADDYVSWK